MEEITHGVLELPGLCMHIAECGSGPAVLLCHGFPELWYSWRHQLTALAQAGYHAIAPDMRGYGGTDAPEAIDAYTMLHLTGDMVALLDALSIDSAVVAGHDWGAPVAWHCALLRPDRFRGVIGLSVPYLARRAGTSPPSSFWARDDNAMYYQAYFQEPGVAEADLGADPRTTHRRLLVGAAGDAPSGPWQGGRPDVGMVPLPAGFVASIDEPVSLPAWLTNDDIEYYASEYQRTGFRGGLNWYRNIDRNWQLTAPFVGALVRQPALYIAGERDAVLSFRGMDRIIPNLGTFVPNLRGTVILPGCGHWTQQERPDEVNAALIEFLKGL
jgi:pimeloyl-ACP methyl ester carboxylesterase